MLGRIKKLVLAAALVALAAPAAASATFPGSNGRIFFDVGGGSGAAIFSIDPDGSDRQQIVDGAREPAISADGKQLAYTKGGDLYTAGRLGGGPEQVIDTQAKVTSPSFAPSGNRIVYATASTGRNPGHIFTVRLDGSERTAITKSESSDESPEFSPGGGKIVFVRTGSDGVSQIYKMDADGSNRQQVTFGEFACQAPTWSPDGDRIAFEGFDGSWSIYSANTNGTGLLQLTDSELGDREPAYSPSGQKIVFRGTRDEDESKGLIVIGADGSALQQITTRQPGAGVGVDADPAWSSTP